FTSTHVDLAAFTPKEPKAKQAPTSAPAPSQGGGGVGGKGGRIFSDDPLPFDLISKSDGELHYRAAKVLAKGATIDDLTVAATWRNGEFNLKPLTAGVGGGKVNVEFASNPKAPPIAPKVPLTRLHLSPLLP